MNIKEAEKLSGISGQNIRYYEKQGLIRPKRNQINSYREYGEEARRVFTFIPDDAVTNPREFTNALLAYAKEKNLNLVITKEGMYPEFEIDGVEYRAERNYGRAFPFRVFYY